MDTKLILLLLGGAYVFSQSKKVEAKDVVTVAPVVEQLLTPVTTQFDVVKQPDEITQRAISIAPSVLTTQVEPSEPATKTIPVIAYKTQVPYSMPTPVLEKIIPSGKSADEFYEYIFRSADYPKTPSSRTVDFIKSILQKGKLETLLPDLYARMVQAWDSYGKGLFTNTVVYAIRDYIDNNKIRIETAYYRLRSRLLEGGITVPTETTIGITTSRYTTPERSRPLLSPDYTKAMFYHINDKSPLIRPIRSTDYTYTLRTLKAAFETVPNIDFAMHRQWFYCFPRILDPEGGYKALRDVVGAATAAHIATYKRTIDLPQKLEVYLDTIVNLQSEIMEFTYNSAHDFNDKMRKGIL